MFLLIPILQNISLMIHCIIFLDLVGQEVTVTGKFLLKPPPLITKESSLKIWIQEHNFHESNPLVIGKTFDDLALGKNSLLPYSISFKPIKRAKANIQRYHIVAILHVQNNPERGALDHAAHGDYEMSKIGQIFEVSVGSSAPKSRTINLGSVSLQEADATLRTSIGIQGNYVNMKREFKSCFLIH